ncbi:protein FAM117A-like isoform X1 [Lampris incognitus]|uniref:protein FAM117A-like isoform X1 n=1 Tax=Lampris incognitus TaxID=2546036 RepID=UPI0024B5A8C5|nr:protein FAM117A-like isoform X1 [Lampris incognitus]
MSGRGGRGQSRGAAVGPQPLRATVPYQLHRKARLNPRDGKSAGKSRSNQPSLGMRRTMSLDAIVGPYLQGHWPKEAEALSRPQRRDISTQTPESWSDRTESKKGTACHKRSASWGSMDHLQESQPVPIPLGPLSRLAPRLRCSVEGLNQELEGMLVSVTTQHQRRLLEVPDGHRAPVPTQSCSSASQSDALTTSLSESFSNSSSPSSSLSSSPATKDLSGNLDQSLLDGLEMILLSPLSAVSESDPSAPPVLSSSPRPNKSLCFLREPPEGCEKVRVWEEVSTPRLPKPSLISSRPDPNKVNFTPYGGSAFCPVSLLQPLLPSVDLLFRNRTASPPSDSAPTTAI